MKKLAERLRELVGKGTQANATRRFQWLANNSTVSAEAWRSFWNGKQRPSAEMIEAAAHIWPNYAFWLATGIDDVSHGHLSPWNGRTTVADPSLPRTRTAARELFIAEIAYEKWRDESGWTRDVEEQDRQRRDFEGDGKYLEPDPRDIEASDFQRRIFELGVIRADQEKTLAKLERDYDWLQEPEPSDEDVIVKRENAGTPDERTVTNVPVHLKYAQDDEVHSRYFDWGYVGKAPNIFAANILYHFGMPLSHVMALRNKFEGEVISSLHRAADRISANQIREWIKENDEDGMRSLFHSSSPSLAKSKK